MGVDSPTDGLDRDAEHFSPLRHRFGLAVGCEQSVLAFVSPLNSWCCPSAVRWPVVRLALIALAARVIPVGVDAVNGVRRRWLLSHAGQERREVVEPSAYADASAAIVGVPAISLR